MRYEKFSIKAVISFLAFLIIFFKELMVSYLKVIPYRGKLNIYISWFIILPLSMVAIVFSILAVRDNYLKKIRKSSHFFDTNFILSVPGIFLLFYSLSLIIEIIIKTFFSTG